MAKALLGHIGVSQDLQLVHEVSRLRARVRELEGELARVKAENDRFAASVRVGDDDLLRLSDLEHAGL
jgi:uncharacterized small protein (DUF1192 family)